jgi:hypothetical protein
MKTELVVALIAGAVAIVSAGVSYHAQQTVAASRGDLDLLRSRLQQQHERQIPFLERQLKLYFEAADTASKIANSQVGSDRSGLTHRFWELYWGPLAVVEDETVVAAMVEFGNALKDEPSNNVALKRLSLKLAHACRNSLQKLWDTDLGKLTTSRPEPKPEK